MTANAVSSLSLEPLLLLVAFDNEARTLPVVRETGRFGVNVLAAGQEDLARLFASKTPEREKFAGVAHTVHDGIPVHRGRARLGRLPARAADPGRRPHDRDRRRRGRRGRRRRAADLVPRGVPDVTAVHVAIGVALIAVNLAAGLWGLWGWWRHRHAPGFWPLLRVGQGLVMLQARRRRAPARAGPATCPSCT